MPRSDLRAALWLSAAALVPAISAPGGAQEPARDISAQRDTVEADTAGAAALERIVITALRLPTEIRVAPYAVSRNDADVTRSARPGLALTEPLYGIPGVQVDNRFNFSLGERVMVRGFGARTQFGVRGVRVVVDGIPATMPDGQTTLNHLDLGTIESVEVVRTPLAALYGNAAGGVIVLHTAAAPTAPLVSRSRFVAGSHGLARRQTGVAGTSGNSSYSMNVGRLTYEGYRAHNSADNRYLSARNRTNVGDNSVTLTAHHVEFDALNPGALPDSLLVRDRTAAFPTNVTQKTGQSARHSQVGVSLERPLGGQQLTVATYAVRRSLENPIPPRIIDLSRVAGGVRASVGSGAGSAARFGWDAGVETAAQRDDRRNYRNVAGERDALTLDQEEEVRMAAVFAAAHARVSPALTVQAGIRRDATRFEADDRLVGNGEPDDSGVRSMRAWSPSVGVSFEIAPAARVFANVGTAFETPTTTELANQPTGAGGFNPELQPQRTVAQEIGVNGAAGRTYYQAALYRARVSDALVPFEVPAAPGRQFFRNAASAVHRGAELMIGGDLHASVRARMAYTYTDPRYREYTVSGVAYDGNRIPGVTPHRLEAALHLSHGRAFAHVESRYYSRVAVNDANDAFSPPYALHSVRGGFTGTRGGWLTFTPFVGLENILGRRYNTSVAVNAIGGRYFEPGPGRTVYFGADLELQAIAPRERRR